MRRSGETTGQRAQASGGVACFGLAPLQPASAPCEQGGNPQVTLSAANMTAGGYMAEYEFAGAERDLGPPYPPKWGGEGSTRSGGRTEPAKWGESWKERVAQGPQQQQEGGKSQHPVVQEAREAARVHWNDLGEHPSGRRSTSASACSR